MVVVPLSSRDAQRPPGGTGGRADDRGGDLIELQFNPRPHVEVDTYPPGTLDRVLAAGFTPEAIVAEVKSHGLGLSADAAKAIVKAHHDRPRCWSLSVPRPATFAEMVELGAIDVNDLAVPVGTADLAGGF